MNWKPNTRPGVLIGSGIMLLTAAIDAGLLWRVTRGPLNGLTFVCAFVVFLTLAPLAVVAYRIYDLVHLRYAFDRNRLLIVTAAVKQIVPMRRIEKIRYEQPKANAPVLPGIRPKARIKGLVWPGCYVGPGEVEGIGLTLFYGVSPPSEQLIVVTPSVAYGISAPDVQEFRGVFDACQALGPQVEVRQESTRAAYVDWPIWQDRLAQGALLGGALLCAVLFAVLLFRYPHLPQLLPMHYDAVGRVDRIAPRTEAFDLPTIGLITWATNVLLGIVFYRRQRMLSYLAWSGTLVVLVLILIALWNIVT
jgi:hypothetical protein